MELLMCIKTFTLILSVWICQFFHSTGLTSRTIGKERNVVDTRIDALTYRLLSQSESGDDNILVRDEGEGIKSKLRNVKNLTYLNELEEMLNLKKLQEFMNLKDLEKKFDVKKLQDLMNLTELKELKEKINLEEIKEKMNLSKLEEIVKLNELREKINLDHIKENIKSEKLEEIFKLQELKEKVNLEELKKTMKLDKLEDMKEKIKSMSLEEFIRMKELEEKLNLNERDGKIKSKYKTVKKVVLSFLKKNKFIYKKLQWMHKLVQRIDAYLENKIFKELRYIDKWENNPNIDSGIYTRIKLTSYGKLLALPFLVLLIGLICFSGKSAYVWAMLLCGLAGAMFVYLFIKTVKYELASVGISEPTMKEYYHASQYYLL
ncbi:Pv-fam-b protein [Plasmodium cynomolgi strain B]|uniref:Pv-fam-b protein n=1 Tax=Plasmodium cynomolgi (strain B) TaxID=1120755 RepID=K6UID1_PLACD|nr:Pv-fam-b protein [Plasmodium cynomolgi strain B]GAB64903.1 Pv-fam-b protein [Plasmodium cynomolgi strain B]